jgi:hypothetical protein
MFLRNLVALKRIKNTTTSKFIVWSFIFWSSSLFAAIFSRIYLEQCLQFYCSTVRTVEQRKLVNNEGAWWFFTNLIILDFSRFYLAHGFLLVTICFYNPSATPSGYRVLVWELKWEFISSHHWHFQTKAMTIPWGFVFFVDWSRQNFQLALINIWKILWYKPEAF